MESDEGLYGLFVCEDYVEKTWEFEDLTQPLLCSNMSSTDHDLTGQIVWPACVLLSWFIYKNRDQFKDKVVIELGAGCGLGGFVAAHYSSKCIITDGNDIVCNLLIKNKEHLQTENVEIAKLLWGLKGEIESTLPLSSSHPDIIIGADVILWPNQIIHLLHTLRWLLALKHKQSKCFISYIVRANTTTERLFATADKLGLQIDTVPVESFVPVDCRDFDSLQKMLLCISIKPDIDIADVLAREDADTELQALQMDTVNRPC